MSDKTNDGKDKKIKQKPWQVAKNVLKMTGKVWRFAPDYIIGTAVEGVIWGILNSIEIVFINKIFNSFDEGLTFPEIAVTIGIMLACYLAGYIFDGAFWEWYNPRVKQKLEYRIHKELFEVAQRADLACYDDPAYFNDFVWAMDGTRDKAVGTIDTIGKIINRLVASGAVLTVLFTIDTLVTVILLVSSVAMIFLRLAGNKLNFRLEKESQPISRKTKYINRTYHIADCAKELRTSHVHDNLTQLFNSNFDENVKLTGRYNRKFFFIWGIGWSVLYSLSYYGTLIYMFFRLTAGAVLLGGFAASINATWRLRWLLTDLITRFTKFPEYSLFIEKYFNFLDRRPKIISGDKIPGDFESLEIRDLTFSYGFGESGKAPDDGKAGSGADDRPVLENVSLSIKKGGKIALVGYNGAGKTTLIKLIMRLYDPTGGQILYNGTDIREYDLALYRERIGAVFQDFKLFAASIGENVLCGDLTGERRADVLRALDAVTFTEKLNELPAGLDTPLTREFDDKGVNLSGGESQKIAIARVFAGDAQLYIMDEPSSALDPMAEYALNHAILQNAEDKTVIFISHRLSTTRMADTIYMFDGGRLVESGSHDELMERDGKYAEMFRVQAKKYTDNLTA